MGYGHAGRGIHARLAREAGYTVAAVVTRDLGRRQQAAFDWPGVRLYEDLDALVDGRAGFDLAVIASPTLHHADHAAHLARVAIPFVLDKPIGVDLFEARAVLAEAAATNTPFTVFQNRRWDSEQLTLLRLLDQGSLGDVHTFERRWERWRPVPQQRWKENDAIGGGLLLDLGSHLVDSAVQLFGPATSVYAQLRSLTTAADDDVFLTLTHSEGGGLAKSPHAVVSRLWAGSVVGAPGPRTRVLGTKAAYLVTSFEQEASPFEVMDAGAPADAIGWLVCGREREPVVGLRDEHVDFYRALQPWLRGETAPPVDPADAVHTAEVLGAARKSATTGRVVRLSD